MNVKLLYKAFVRVILSVVFAGIFYTVWMAVSIIEFRSGLDSIVLKILLWLIGPIVTALGFATGLVISERVLRSGEKSKFLNVFKWSLAGCAIGAASFVWFGPMLIVFGMFLVGTASVALREIVRIKKQR